MKFFHVALAVACALLFAETLNSCTTQAQVEPAPMVEQFRIYTFLHRGW